MRAACGSVPAGAEPTAAAGRLREAADAHEVRTGSDDLESKAEEDKWQKIMVEAKELKRQWADLEDSDEEPPGAGGG